MKRSHAKKGCYAFIFTVMILGLLMLFGCGGSGDTGATGPAGPPGTTGEPGTPSPEATTGETCAICHGTGKIADIAVKHPNPTGQDVILSSISLTNTGGTPSVSFNAATADGPVTDLTLDDIIFMIANLVPENTATISWGTFDSPYFERWAYERTGVDTRNNNTPYPHGTFDTSDAANGNYTYNFVTPFADATVEAPEYNEADTQRLAIIVSGHNDANGNAVTNNTVGFLDFVTPTGGGAVTTSVSQRLFVTADACKKCHGAPFQQAAHADRYLDTRTCVICHSPLGHYGTTMQDDSAWASVFFHKIHAAIGITRISTGAARFEEEVRGLGFEGVTYPQKFSKHPEQGTEEILNCVSCHSNPNNRSLGTGDKIDNWETHPTTEVCVSCHVDVDFASGTNHAGGAQVNGDCDVCHKTGGIAPTVAEAHDTTPTGVNIPEFDVALDITQPKNGVYYVAGEAPEVRVTLKIHSTSSNVDPSIYGDPQDGKGITGGGLNVASLYVYGPRAKAFPVLATGTSTDPNFDSATDSPTQAHSLFANGTDPQVTTDLTGFGYQLLEIPADMTPGTYMVRVRIADYGYISSTNYRIESTAFKTIQIGTATDEKKVAGDNPVYDETTCVVCHGDRTAPFHDARHVVAFNTDECLACHDQSGNHPDALTNRIHAVHSANSAGDIINLESPDNPSRDWSDITFPQNIQAIVTGHTVDDGPPRCIACHTLDTSSGTYLTNPFMLPCVGCHTFDGDLDHMRQNGGPF